MEFADFIFLADYMYIVGQKNCTTLFLQQLRQNVFAVKLELLILCM